jgi:hypothetical protein
MFLAFYDYLMMFWLVKFSVLMVIKIAVLEDDHSSV